MELNTMRMTIHENEAYHTTYLKYGAIQTSATAYDDRDQPMPWRGWDTLVH